MTFSIRRAGAFGLLWMAPVSVLALALKASVPSASPDALGDLARDFWAWRAVEQPLSSDDIPRIERPAGWQPDWSPASVAARRRDLLQFEERWTKIEPASGWPVSEQVDYRLMGSAIARVRWELELDRSWNRDPTFYVDQTLGAVFDSLLPPPPFDSNRSADIVRRMASIPATVADAERNLLPDAQDPGARAPFARLAISELADAGTRLRAVSRALDPVFTAGNSNELDEAAVRGGAALESYRAWIEQRLPSMPSNTAVGEDAYRFFLHRVALMPFEPEELIRMSRPEWARSIAEETLEEHRDAGLPSLPLFTDQAAEIAAEARDEASVREFLRAKQILSIPAWLHHYVDQSLPAYLEPLADLGVTDDLTGPARLNQNAVHYIPKPSLSLPYFDLASARDPRPILVHEGIPGHYLQLALSWHQDDPIRRHYYDSGANEGIGFYAEEMMLEAGYFDSSPRTREMMDNFMRLRALRVEADVRLALGTFTIEQAARYLAQTVPMDPTTARDEASFFAATPGQGISYQIGKLQIVQFLADARKIEGSRFDLRAFHDYVWKNGNVPIALQRAEYLGPQADRQDSKIQP